MFAPLSPVAKAFLNLASLVLIWVGTLTITFVGVPAIVTVLLAREDGAVLTTEGGAMLAAEPDPRELAAYGRYMLWAGAGMFLITLGMACQAVEPSGVLLEAAYKRRGSRP